MLVLLGEGELMENFEISTANGQYNKEFIDKCFNELRAALALQYAQQLSPCQKLALHILQDGYEVYLDGERARFERVS